MPSISRFDTPAVVMVGKSDDLRFVGHKAERLKDFSTQEASQCVSTVTVRTLSLKESFNKLQYVPRRILISKV